jgi:flagellar basal body-associated protein FliL
MHGLKRKRPLCLIAAVTIVAALALPAVSLAASTPVFIKESQQAYEKQLKSGVIAEATFNKKLRNLHIKTKSGELFLYHYPKKGEQALAATLTAHHIPVTVLKPSEAAKESKPAKHKLRYIAGGIVIVVILIVGVVLLVNRRRQQDE